MAISKRLAAGEELCSACAGTGLAKVRQPAKPGRRVYPPKCAKCGGKGRVILMPQLGTSQSVEIALPGGYNVTPRLAQALKLLPGVEQVEEL